MSVVGVAGWGGRHPILLLAFSWGCADLSWLRSPSGLTCSYLSRPCTAWGWCCSQVCMLPGHGAML